MLNNDWRITERELPQADCEVFVSDGKFIYTALFKNGKFSLHGENFYIKYWCYIIWGNLPDFKPNIEIGKVYRDEIGNRFLCIYYDEERGFKCIDLISGCDFFFDKRGSCKLTNPLIELSENQFPGTI